MMPLPVFKIFSTFSVWFMYLGLVYGSKIFIFILIYKIDLQFEFLDFLPCHGFH